jgi:hypothetical protein
MTPLAGRPSMLTLPRISPVVSAYATPVRQGKQTAAPSAPTVVKKRRIMLLEVCGKK